MIHGSTEIKIVCTICRSIIKQAHIHIKIRKTQLVLCKDLTGNTSKTICRQLVFKFYFKNVEPFIYIGSLESKTYLVRTIFIQCFMVSCRKSQESILQNT